jgi:hypothetical protein
MRDCQTAGRLGEAASASETAAYLGLDPKKPPAPSVKHRFEA